MEIYVFLGGFLALLIFFGIQANRNKKRKQEQIRRKLNKLWGNESDREYKGTEFERIRKYFDALKRESFVDDITWNDLGMDNIFAEMNYTQSSIGEDCLYDRLRRMDYSDDELKEFDEVVNYFYSNKDICIKYLERFAEIGRTKSISIYEFIHNLTKLGTRSNTVHYLFVATLISAIALIFLQPGIGVLATIFMVCVNVVQYYKMKAKVESFFLSCGYLTGVIAYSKDIYSIENEELKKYSDELKRLYQDLSPIVKNSYLLSSNTMSGSIGEIILEYARMLFHIDLIKFNSIITKTIEKLDKVDRMYELLGYIESACAVAFYRAHLNEYYGYYCNPEFKDIKGIKANEVYHPILSKPVANSIFEDKCVLLTGSNASGKSTFLKTIGINAVLSQTIYTCSAKSFEIKRCKVYSSMSLKDDIQNNESYYIVEIKALKRIIDAAKKGENIVCFVDEVLRGTNTVERVSASTEILKSFADGNINNVLCFAATHDIELTHLLEQWYGNYHFEEEIKDDDVLFNYQLKEGRATSRNAISLLKVMGYDEAIINAARARADKFTETGKY